MEEGKYMKNTHIIEVKSNKQPVITIDSETKAVYIKFSQNKIAKTLQYDSTGSEIVTLDIDRNGNVVGVELIGVKKFSIAATTKLLSDKIKGVPDLREAQLVAC